MRALAQDHFDWIKNRVLQAADEADADAYCALGDMLEAIMERLVTDRLMVEVMSRTKGLDTDAVFGALDQILAVGRQQRTLRDDAAVQDIAVLITGSAQALLNMGIDDPTAWRRCARLTLAALRP